MKQDNARLCWLSETRKQKQKPARKDLEPNDQRTVIRLKATYIPVSKRFCFRS
ncbi:transcriptional regulator [Lacticaseibacillus paracasei]|nr:transcriptional regulator [Lacticaseibacillus paracasei]